MACTLHEAIHCCSDLPMQGMLSWRRTFVDDLKLKRNWRFKRCIVQSLHGHTARYGGLGKEVSAQYNC